MFVGTPLMVTIRLPLTRPFRKGAAGFWKICCWEPVNCLAFCCQFVFSMAMTNTVLTDWADATEAERTNASARTHGVLRIRSGMQPPNETVKEVHGNSRLETRG